MDYKASKAWHFGHSLALDVRQLAHHLPKDDEFQLALKMRRASSTAPLKIAESMERTLQKEKLECYMVAREAIVESQSHLALARDLHYIEQQLFEELARQVIMTHNLLSSLIRSLSTSSPAR